MLTKHEYPQTMLIELSGISNLIAYLLNELSGYNYINIDIAYEISIKVLQYNLNIRCLWLNVSQSYMGVVDKEQLLLDIDIPEDYKSYLINAGDDAFIAIETAMSELLDMYVPKKTWYIWSISNRSMFTACLINDGDYRIHQWSQDQKANRTQLGYAYSIDTLGLIQ